MIAAARIAGVLAAASALAALGGFGQRAEAGASGADDLGRAATLAAACSGCHLTDGEAIAGLDARSEGELAALLTGYRSDKAGTSVMHRLARGYSEADIRLVAAYLAARKDR
ncbi:MAG: cytochrome c [Sphingomonadales bacterium]